MSPHLKPPGLRKAVTGPAGRIASARNAVGSTRRSTRTHAKHARRPFPPTRREVAALRKQAQPELAASQPSAGARMGRCRQAKSAGGPVTIFDGQVGDARVLQLPAWGMRGVSWQRARQLAGGKPDFPAAIAGAWVGLRGGADDRDPVDDREDPQPRRAGRCGRPGGSAGRTRAVRGPDGRDSVQRRQHQPGTTGRTVARLTGTVTRRPPPDRRRPDSPRRAAATTLRPEDPSSHPCGHAGNDMP